MPKSRRKLGDIFLKWGLARPETIEAAAAFAAKEGIRIGEALVRMGVASASDVMKALALQYDVDTSILPLEAFDKHAYGLLPLDFMERWQCVPYSRTDDQVHLLILDPTNVTLIDAATQATGLKIIPVVTDPYFVRLILRYLASGSPIPQVVATYETLPDGWGFITYKLDDDAGTVIVQAQVEPSFGRPTP